MELILVRHGEPAWTTPEGLGRNDPGLTDRGHAQARLVAARLADPDVEPVRGPVDRLYVSPAVRAAETCAPIAEALGKEPETLDWLWELRNPDDWEGAPIDAISEAFEGLRGGTREDWWQGHEGGEPIRDFHRRVTEGLEGMLGGLGAQRCEEPGLWTIGPEAPDRVIAVAHGGTNGMILGHLLGVAAEPWEWERFCMGHASVALLATVPVAGANIWSLRGLGDANHLPLTDRTL